MGSDVSRYEGARARHAAADQGSAGSRVLQPRRRHLRLKSKAGFTPAAIKAFFWYIEERESIRLRKEKGEPWPWTKDPILSKFKFTNVRRINDRTTQHFLRVYEAHPKEKPHVALYNCAVRRYYGTMQFSDEIGWLKKHDKKKLIKAARALFKRGQHVFTGAYIITNSGKSQPKEVTVADILGRLWKESRHIVDSVLWMDMATEMRKVSGFGGSGFMTKEALQDYILWADAAMVGPIEDALTWTPVGPGARRGLNRLLGREVRYNQKEDLFFAEIDELRTIIQPLWQYRFPKGGKLSAHDIQFCLCEFDKLERVRHGQGRPRSVYRPTAKQMKFGKGNIPLEI